MSEFYPDAGLGKSDYHRISRHQANSDFDNKLKNKSFFTSSSSIENERKKALEKIDETYYGRSGGGFVE